MPFKIRTKLIIAFFAVIFPFLLAVGFIAIYNLNIIHKGINRVEVISNETQAVMGLQLALDRALMPGNDYIITGKEGQLDYIEGFKWASADVEERLREVEQILARMKESPEAKEEIEILKGIRAAWQNIKEISLKIFAIQNPVGNRDAAMLMEEMDYRWAYPAIKGLERWQEIDKEEYREAHEESGRAWKQAWIIMIAGVVILLSLGGSFAVFYSRIFVRPIEAIHEGADAIAGGDFKTRLDIKTGDEIEQLAGAMNEMAAQLDSFTSNLEGLVAERTEELAESEERFRIIAETAADAIITMKQPGVVTLWNKSAERIFGYKADEAIGKDLHDIIVPERYRDKSREGLKNFFETGSGPVVGKAVEITGLRRDGSEFPVELSISAMRMKDEWQTAAIVRDITERKKAEDKIREQLDYLERFQKVAVKREFRIKELKDEVDALKAKIEEMGKK